MGQTGPWVCSCSALPTAQLCCRPVCSLKIDTDKKPGPLDPTLGGLYFPATWSCFLFLGICLKKSKLGDWMWSPKKLGLYLESLPVTRGLG